MKSQPRLIDRILQYRVPSHILFWVFLLGTFSLSAFLSTGTLNHFYNNIAMLPAQLAAAYFLNYYQVPKLLFKKRYGAFALSLFLSIYLLAVIARCTVVYIAEPLFREDFTQESLWEILWDVPYLFAVYFPAVYMYALIMLIIKTIKKRFEEKHEIEVLYKEKAKNELKFLKAQIQPHFLFNTLNNLYALTLSKSDLAPQVVLKLSELLDFILYQSDEPTIPVEKEIELIQGFLDLESLRYGDDLDLIFEHSVDEPSTPIAPLLLLPLVENAFKHGSSGSPENAKIHIHLLVQSQKLSFSVFNSKPEGIEMNNGNSGIGIANLRRQLELNYPNQYELEAKDAQDSYWVKLSIDLQ
ncbi:sensor histidine kinase [Aureisphaera galaxeae]|uniref:sensor histidine kinase n=1 Tax=Aureisphaera galaxeae TaxID=1538023 RepID=UPI00234FCC69|nr:sensor histidine kinase [Aureisphaera galaxeae]MDC8004077.1 sensor histidine kinase [Aureisphaera galaxeae]